ncbi:MAG: DNA-directed RNA polymerase subunit omega [Prochlorotrichaceae cyanobacterium]|jgi:DNA-directed RNA polymerase subunit omega
MVNHDHHNMDVIYRAEDLIRSASNRYRITVQIARRAKRCRYEDFDGKEEVTLKPVKRAILEMSDELIQPGIITE